jgi:hypothetical protein
MRTNRGRPICAAGTPLVWLSPPPKSERERKDESERANERERIDRGREIKVNKRLIEEGEIRVNKMNSRG